MSKMNRNPLVWALSALSIIALASCSGISGGSKVESSDPQPATTSEATVESEAESEAASSEEEATSASQEVSSVQSSQYITVELIRDTIPNGTCFYDACRPTVIYHDDTTGETEDVTEYTYKTLYSISPKGDSEVTYGAGDVLPAGEYVANISHKARKNYKTSIAFTVNSVEPEMGREGHGYYTMDIDAMSDTTFTALPALDTLGGHGMPTLGDVNILVIPVEFNNATFESVRGTKEGEVGGEFVRQVLHEAFFAESDETPWESLSSYYKKSSHGKLNIGGDVTPVFRYNHNDTDPDVVSASGLATSICAEAVSWLKSEKGYDMRNYDADKDGYIDGIELVYATTHLTPSSSGGDDDNSTWWNYTTNAGGGANVNNPGARRMFWSRWDYLTNSYYVDVKDEAENDIGYRVRVGDTGKTAVDAHTIIHETGHMMGAPDYYSYDKDEGVAGCVDMMDNNVGDHNAYTKMAYGWAAPKVVDGSSKNFTMTINSWTDTGDFVLVRPSDDSWNGTPWDEFLMLQYYTPTGVNEKDSTGYPEWQHTTSAGGSAYGHGGTYKAPGLQIFHVDGRTASQQAVVEGGKIGTKKWAYTDTPRATAYTGETTWEGPAKGMHTNTMNASGRQSADLDENGKTLVPTDVRELSIVLPSGVNSFKTSSYYNNFGNMANLFGLNSYWGDPTAKSADEKYGGSFYSNFSMRAFFPVHGLAFNDGSVNDWNIEIVEQTDSDITLHFTNVNANAY